MTNALTGQGVSGCRCIADEQHRSVGEHGPIHPGRNRPRRTAALGPGMVAQHGPDRRPVHEAAPDLSGVSHGHRTATEDAEAHVCPTTWQGEGPRVPGQQIRLEPHMQIGGGWAHVGHVLAEGMPLATVVVGGQPEESADGRPHAVGGHHCGGPYRPQTVDVHRRSGPVLGAVPGVQAEAGDRMSFEHLGARGPHQVQERRVVLPAGDDHCVSSVVSRQREADRTARRRVDHRVIHRLPAADRGGIQAELLAETQGQRGQAVAAALVPREGRLVDQQYRSAGPGRRDGRRAAGRAAAHHQHVDRPGWSVRHQFHGHVLRRASAHRTRCPGARRSRQPRNRCPGRWPAPGPEA